MPYLPFFHMNLRINTTVLKHGVRYYALELKLLMNPCQCINHVRSFAANLLGRFHLSWTRNL